MIVALSLGLIMSAVVCAVLTAVAVPLLDRAQAMDVTGTYGQHERPAPRGGGVAIVLAMALVMGAAPAALWNLEGLEQLAARFDVMLLGTATILVCAVLGLADDLFSLSWTTRLISQTGLGLLMGMAVTAATDASPALSILVAMSTIGLTGACRLLDSANGLTAGYSVVTALWFVTVAMVHPVPGLGLTMITLAGACLGFAPFHALVTRVLLGSCGAYALGGAWSFAITVCLAHGVAVDIALAPVLVLIADTAVVVWMTVRHGLASTELRRFHVHQRLEAAGWPHWAASSVAPCLALVCCALAYGDFGLGSATPLAVGAAAVVLFDVLVPGRLPTRQDQQPAAPSAPETSN